MMHALHATWAPCPGAWHAHLAHWQHLMGWTLRTYVHTLMSQLSLVTYQHVIQTKISFCMPLHFHAFVSTSLCSPYSTKYGLTAWKCCAAEEEEGTHLAGLTALVRLLELKLYELEGEQGTGPLEDDIRLLEVRNWPLDIDNRHGLFSRL